MYKTWQCEAINGSDISVKLIGKTLIFSGIGKMKDFSTLKFENATQTFVFEIPIKQSILQRVHLFDNYLYHSTERPWAETEVFQNVIIEDGITHIGDCTFFNTSIKSIEIPDSVKTIGHAAFKDCDFLENIHISENIEHIGAEVFSNCKNLKRIQCLSTSLHKNRLFDSRTFQKCDINKITFCINKKYQSKGIPKNLKHFNNFEFCDTNLLIDKEINQKEVAIEKLTNEINLLNKLREDTVCVINEKTSDIEEFMQMFKKYETYNIINLGQELVANNVKKVRKTSRK